MAARESREPDAGTAPPKALVRALRTILRPLVHLLVARQIPYAFLANLLKAVYVEVADRDFPLAGRRPTDSRINLLTGVHRKDVRRLREALSEGDVTPPIVSLGAQLVARWNAAPGYVDAYGHPRPLPIQSTQEPSFESLVGLVSNDIRARSVLDEWLRLGVVHIDEQARVTLAAGAFVPQKGLEEKLFYFGRNVSDHLATAAHNVLGGEPPRMERSVYYGRLSPESVEEIARLASEAGMEALQKVNRRALELQERDAGREDARRRMTFGAYFFEGASRAPSEDESDE